MDQQGNRFSFVRSVAAVVGLWCCTGVVAQATTGAFFPAQATLATIPFYPSLDIAIGDVNDDGAPDVVGANAILNFGPNTMPFHGVLYNENATQYASFAAGLATFPVYMNGYRRVAVADFDEDGEADVMTLSWPFELVLSRNQGQAKVIKGFPASTIAVPSFAPLLGLNFPNTNADPVASVPIFLADDFDGDGHVDVVVGVALANGMFGIGTLGISGAGLVFCFGNGDGTFAPPQLVTTPDTPLDGDFVDWDGNGSRDTLLWLGQNAVVTSLSSIYTAQLTRYQVVTTAPGVRTVNILGQAQALGSNTYTSLAYIPGTATTPRILGLAGHEFPSSSQMRPYFWITEIDASGGVQQAPYRITPSIAATGDSDLQGIQAADFDLDGHLDLVGLVDVVGTSSVTPTQPTEIAFVAGPFDAFGAHGVTGGIHFPNTWSLAMNRPAVQQGIHTFMPNRSCPEVLRVVDWNHDGAPDLVGSNVFWSLSTSVSAQRAFVTVLNTSPTSLGLQTGRVDRIGHGTSNPSGRRARCAVQGGAPLYGNAAFRVSLRDAPMAGIAALAGSYSYAPTTLLGLDAAFVPDSWGWLQTLSAPQEGAGRLEQALPLPANPALLGSSGGLFQWAIFDANTGTLECSDALYVGYGH